MSRVIALALAAGLVAMSAGAHAQSWQFDQRIDPITDQPSYTLSLALSANEYIGVHCRKETWGLAMRPAGFHFAKEGTEQSVTVRFDQDPPVETQWMAGGKSTFFVLSDVALPLFERAAAASRIVIRVKNSTTVYNITDRGNFELFLAKCPHLRK